MDDSFNTHPTLLFRVKEQRDEQSWEEFVHYYNQYIYLICRRMEMKHHDAEEAVQTVLLKLWEKLPNFEYDSNLRFRGWLCMITGNVVKDFFRKDKKATSTNIDISRIKIDEETSEKSNIERIAEEEWQNYITTLALHNIRAKFSPQVIDIFLALHEGNSRTVVAAKFNLPVNTISVYKKRVVTALCKEIRRLEKCTG